MAGELQPLAQNFKIVDENGFPSLYFIKWAQQRQLDIGDSLTLLDLQAYLTAHKLREGSGIQFTPDGDLNNAPLIAADVQEILDQISATRGTLLYRGLLGWAALAPGTATYLLQTNGAGADPTWVAPPSGGGGNPWWWAPPLAASFPTLVSFDATMPTISDTTHGGMKLLWPSNYGTTDQSRGCLKALPAGVDWTVTGHFQTMASDTNFTYGGLCIRNAAANKTLTYARNNFATLSGHIIIGQTANTGQALLNAGPLYGLNAHPMHLRLRYTTATTTLALDFSWDGENFIQGDSRNVGALLGAAPDQVGFKLHAGSSLAAAGAQQPFMMIDRWEQSF